MSEVQTRYGTKCCVARLAALPLLWSVCKVPPHTANREEQMRKQRSFSYRHVHRFTAKSWLVLDAVLGYWLKYMVGDGRRYRITIEEAR